MTRKSTTRSSKKPARNKTDSASEASEAAFNRLIPTARAIPRAEVVPLRADIRLAVHNASTGAKALLARAATVKKTLPATRLDDIRQIPSIGAALAYADRRIDHERPPTGLRAKLTRVYELRSLLLSTATALVHAGLLPARKVHEIHSGSGGYDAAGDCVALASLLRANAARIKGKHPVTTAQIDEAARLGSEVLAMVKPSRARARGRADTYKQALEDRDRLWTLLLERYDELWRAGAYVFGQDMHRSVPALLAHQGGRRKKAAPAPAATQPKTKPKPKPPSGANGTAP